MERELAALPRHLFNSGNEAEYHDNDKALSYAKSSHLPLSARPASGLLCLRSSLSITSLIFLFFSRRFLLFGLLDDLFPISQPSLSIYQNQTETADVPQSWPNNLRKSLPCGKWAVLGLVNQCVSVNRERSWLSAPQPIVIAKVRSTDAFCHARNFLAAHCTLQG